MKFEKITFNFPQEYKRKLEKIVAMENISNENRITLSDLITDTLIKEFDLKNDKTSL
jgi:hypothetical protein